MADVGEKNEKETIRVLYVSLGEAERKLNEIQNTYRILASTWMLATMGAIGYVLSTDSFEVGVDKYIVCWLLAFAGAVSIGVLWLLDMRVYQRLLSRFYAEGIAMERGEPWLPQVRNQTRRLFKGRLPQMISLYYVLLFVFLWAVNCFFLYWSEAILEAWFGRLVMAFGWALLGVGGAVAILWYERPKANTGAHPSTWPDPISDDDRVRDYERRAKEREGPVLHP